MKLLGCFLIYSVLCGALPRPVGAATLQSRLLYEKIPATANGLDLAHPINTPAPLTHLELRTADQKTVLARTTTDDDGRFQFDMAPNLGQVSFFVVAEMGGIQVRDPATDAPYAVSLGPFVPSPEPIDLVIPDRSRLSGPFNILAILRKANRLLEQIEPGLPLADRPLVVYWSPTWDGGTFATESALFILGRRDQDSDEFDDSPILYYYAEYLLGRFTPVSGPRGPAYLGERVDPRQAWVEGWKAFFGQAVLGTPVGIDTQGANGNQAYTYDLEEEQLEGDAPGYWSAWDVATALWDVYAKAGGDGPHLGLGLGPIWRVLREYFPQQVFPYLITLADGLIQQDPSREAGITEILSRREIRYQFGKVPPVPVPFPRLIASGVPVDGHVDSLTTHQTNLIGAADYYLVQKESAEPLRVQFTVTGELSPGDGRLELELLTAAGDRIKGAQLLLWGAGDRSEMTVPLPPGRYVVAVKSSHFGTGFSNAQYELTADF
jgi:hypothetical protein